MDVNLAVSHKDWKREYPDECEQMIRFERWLANCHWENDRPPSLKKLRWRIAALAFCSETLVQEESLQKPLFSMRFPKNASDLVMLFKRTGILDMVIDEDLSPYKKTAESEGILETLRLFVAFLDFRPLTEAELDNYPNAYLYSQIPKRARFTERFLWGFLTFLVDGTALSAIAAAWLVSSPLPTSLLVTGFGLTLLLFWHVIFLGNSFMGLFSRSINSEQIYRVNAKICDVSWERPGIAGSGRVPVLEYTTPNNTTPHRFYLYAFIKSVPLVTYSETYIPLTYLEPQGIVVDAPFFGWDEDPEIT